MFLLALSPPTSDLRPAPPHCPTLSSDTQPATPPLRHFLARPSQWSPSSTTVKFVGNLLKGQTVDVIGAGRIGSAYARMMPVAKNLSHGKAHHQWMRYDVQLNNAILVEDKHLSMYDEMSSQFTIEYIANGATQYSIRVSQRLDDNLTSYKLDLTEAQTAARERHELLENVMKDSRDSVELKVKELQDLVVKEVKQIVSFCTGLKNGLSINKFGYGSSIVKPVTQGDLKNKGKGVHVNPSEEE
ncbi:unnamed protein product [Lactuca saligna]|uniref:Adenosine kinase n=1 Tax=Lactuca saligna TaxID=75948 RepID=A0AA35Z4U4_LACSI|nr:unnamed protein product [Lactuca saligna]